MPFAQADFPFFVSLIGQFGFPIAAVIALAWYFAKRDSAQTEQTLAREARLGQRVDELENFIRSDLAQTSHKVTAALVTNADTMRELAESHRESNERMAALMHRMCERPCLLKLPQPPTEPPGE